LSAVLTGTLWMGKASACSNDFLSGALFGDGGSSTGCLTFRADKAPADVDVLVVAAASPCSEVIGADDAVGGEDHGPSGEAEVIGVVRNGTPHTAHQAT